MTKFNDDYIKYAEMCAKAVRNEMGAFLVGISEDDIIKNVGSIGFLAMKNVGYLEELPVQIGREKQTTFYKIIGRPVDKSEEHVESDTSFESFIRMFYPDHGIIFMTKEPIDDYLNWKRTIEETGRASNMLKICDTCKHKDVPGHIDPCFSCVLDHMVNGTNRINWEAKQNEQ